MKQVFNLLGLDEAKVGDVGIEIECEGERLRVVNNDIWGSEDDGSLRGSFGNRTRMEWVMKKPVVHAKVEEALTSLALAQKDAKLNFSFRTSVHVHVNAQTMTHPQLCAWIYTYLLLEELLMDQCGEERKGNRFCLRAVDAEATFDMLQMVFQNEMGFRHIGRDSFRYSAANLESLNKYGTIEFRGMKGCLDVPHLTRWVDLLMAVRSFGVKSGDPMAVRKTFLEGGTEAFVFKVLGKKLFNDVWSDHYSQDIHRNFSLSIGLPFNWQRADYKAALPKAPPRLFKKEAFAADVVAQAPIAERLAAHAEMIRREHEIRHRAAAPMQFDEWEPRAEPDDEE